MRIISLAILLTLFHTELRAAPITGNEIDLMVRMGVADEQILKDVGKRRLLAPLDPAMERKLTADGASKGLIERIRGGNYALDPLAAAELIRSAAEAKEASARQSAREDAAFAARLARLREPSAPRTGNFPSLFADILQQLDSSGKLAPYPADRLRDVRYFALYNSAAWCGPCRAFTPGLVEAYNRLKPKHAEMEVIFLSADKSPAEMEGYMRTDKMRWPAVKFDRVAAFGKYLKGSIPWMVILDGDGKVLQPGETEGGQWVHPSGPLAWLTQRLGG